MINDTVSNVQVMNHSRRIEITNRYGLQTAARTHAQRATTFRQLLKAIHGPILQKPSRSTGRRGSLARATS